jgi:hypothetical protein
VLIYFVKDARLFPKYPIAWHLKELLKHPLKNSLSPFLLPDTFERTFGKYLAEEFRLLGPNNKTIIVSQGCIGANWHSMA